MPIGKNSIKRVANAGYSNVKTEAPDMENSVIESTPKKTAAKKSAAPTSKKPTAKKAQPAEKKPAAAKAAAKAATPLVTAKKFAVGDELPTYLL